MKLVVVGGVAAGTKAASRARRLDPEMEITIYQAEAETSIGECGLPYLISGTVESRDDLIARTPGEFGEQDIEVFVRHRVVDLDPQSKTLAVRNLASGEEFEDAYDRLLLATGASANLPPVPGAGDLEGVFVLRFLSDADRILEYLDRHTPERAVLIGAGYIGLELAENLVERGLEVCMVELADRALPGYDEEVSKNVERHLDEKGVRVITGAGVDEVLGRERVEAVRVAGEEIPAGVVLAGVGIKPAVELAEAAGIELGETGAIRVDEQLRTTAPDVWAAGDCVESRHVVSGGPVWVPLGDTANQMGRVAGTNVAGGAAEFPGVLGTGVFKVFDLAVAKTGLSLEEAREAGFDATCATVESRSTAGYYPGGRPVFLKLVADRASGRMLGAEAVGGNADKLIDVCATAVWGALTHRDLLNIDLAYAPPFGPTLSPVITAAGVLGNRLEDGGREIGAPEAKRSLPEVQLVDVQPAGTATHSIRGAIRIPLEDLDERLEELDLGSPIVLYCGNGQCSYRAALKLRNAGARDVRELEGGLWGWPYDEDREPVES
jgi:NADPH-dependent 2,4-dienoyl-CoA reductase/sulfur reductase-like enzyme/rhodanese-related sulfurtransferase